MKHVTKTWFRDILAAAALGVVATAAVALVRQPRAGAKVTSNASMLQGREYLDGLRARLQEPSRSPQSQDLQIDALQALYLARVRTGLGSPFRAIESALRDPWLPDSVRAPLASAMLVMASSSGRTATGALAVSPSNAKLIDSVVRAHPEPRRGEETVRIAFDLAAAAGAISATEATTAAELAAVARDAVYARRDVARLIAAAHRGGLTPLDLLPIWREERRFEVERPVVHPIDWASSREVVASAARLFELLDAERPADSTSQGGGGGDQVTQAVRDAVRRLARARNAPPSPAVLQVAGGLLSSRLLPPTTEEELAAGWLNATTLPAADRRAWARVVTAASIRLRTTVQDPVWFAGDPGPTVVDLQQRHGLRSVTFAAAVPTAWRDYALQSIDRALIDARRVLPDLDLRGLRIHVGLKANWPARAMALHDPETRTIYFPLSSAPGVLAHELGHDLDWQVARSVFGEQGIYATDGTARRASEILAAPVEILTGGGAGAVGANARSAVSMRPTEVLARHVDWMMAAALATLGRSNGFLSTVQESGDALGNSSAPRAEQIDAAVSVLATATRVPGHTVHDVRARGNQPLVRDVIARALSTNLGMPWFKRTSVGAAGGSGGGGGPLVEALGNAPLALRNAADPRLARRCMAASAQAAGEPDWVADALALAADARARDVIRRVRRAPPRRFAMRDVAGWTMLRSGLAVGPVDPEVRARSVAMLRREIEWQLTAEMLAPLAQASQAGGPLLCDWR